MAPGPRPDANPTACEAACENLRVLGCEEGQPTPDGAPCEEWCKGVEESGVVTLHPECIAEIETCDQVVDCTE